MEKAQARRFGRRGEPAATCEAVLKVVYASEPPLRIFLGAGPLAIVTSDYQSPPGHMA